MNDGELLRMSGASAGTIAIVLLIYKILKTVIGKRYISHCCGKKMEVGLDVRDSAPTPKEETILEIKTNPMLEDARAQNQEKRSSSSQ